jgi:NitT/TauT family transport system ATP-binding protein
MPFSDTEPAYSSGGATLTGQNPSEQNASFVHADLWKVTKVFPSNNLHALGPIDLKLRRGEFFSVVGPSGCGKSTLLDIWAGLTMPSTGVATFEGRAIKDVPEGVGVVFQEDASFAWLNVWDNIAFGLRRTGVDPAEIRRRVDYAVGFMGLRDFAKSFPAQLSGGMKQRVCIARTLVTQPRFILLDEPFGALDQQTRLLMGEELLRLWRETKATVLLITHALDEAAMLADRVGVMSSRPGCFIDLVETGWPIERDSRLVEDPKFGQISARLWKSLRAESLKVMRGAETEAKPV